MTDTLADAAPEVPGEQPVPASDDFVQPEETVEVQEPELVNGEDQPNEEPETNVNEAEPEPQEDQPEEEPAAKEEPEAEEPSGKRKLEENNVEEPDAKKMNTGPMEVSADHLALHVACALRHPRTTVAFKAHDVVV
jgi:hypothetical protein